jgi:3'-phosphoadenosine 5'-phosphosulfate sulfotransferase (PAPS reductase)/FAD synthetase
MKELLEAHEKIVLQFSGGKDSLACLLLTKPWWDKITVMWTNTGDAFPETIEQMAKIKAMVPHFLEVTSDQPTQVRKHGWPSDVIPVRATEFGRILTSGMPVIQGYPLCCNANIWQPMLEATLRLNATLVLRGTRKDDVRRATKNQTEVIPFMRGQQPQDITFYHPIWDWPATRVFDYVEKKGLLPRHYGETETSLDCMHCTAYLDENALKMRYLERAYPDVSEEVQRRIRKIRSIVESDLEDLERAVI